MSTLLTVLAAVAVVVGMRTVGLLLVSAIMIVPVAAAQQVTASFRATGAVAVSVGLFASVAGLAGAFYLDVPPGPAIVVLALALFVVFAVAALGVRRARRSTRTRVERTIET
jgi:zinc transport system permease protein